MYNFVATFKQYTLSWYESLKTCGTDNINITYICINVLIYSNVTALVIKLCMLIVTNHSFVIISEFDYHAAVML